METMVPEDLLVKMDRKGPRVQTDQEENEDERVHLVQGDQLDLMEFLESGEKLVKLDKMYV